MASYLANGNQISGPASKERKWVVFPFSSLFLSEIFTRMINLNANRKVDALGRIVIPSKLRDKFAIEPGDKVEFFSTYVDGVMYLCMACPHAAPPREETEN